MFFQQAHNESESSCSWHQLWALVAPLPLQTPVWHSFELNMKYEKTGFWNIQMSNVLIIILITSPNSSMKKGLNTRLIQKMLCTITFSNTCVCVHTHSWVVYLCGHEHNSILAWRLKDKLQEVVLLFHHVGPKDHTRAVRPGSKCIYLLNHFTGHIKILF